VPKCARQSLATQKAFDSAYGFGYVRGVNGNLNLLLSSALLLRRAAVGL
jgi:hypothetical protein